MEEYISEPTDLQPENLKQQIEETKQSGGMTFSPGSDEPRKFKQFDIVNDHTDHHFVNGIGNELMLSHVSKQVCALNLIIRHEYHFFMVYLTFSVSSGKKGLV